MSDKDVDLIFEQYCNNVLNESPPPLMVGDVPPPKDVSSMLSREPGRGGSSGYEKALQYGRVGAEDVQSTMERLNRVALRVYEQLRHEQDERVRSGGDPVSEEKWSELKNRFHHFATEEGLKKARAGYFMRFVVNILRDAGIIQVDVKPGADVAHVAPSRDNEAKDRRAIDTSVDQAEHIVKKKPGFLKKIFGG